MAVQGQAGVPVHQCQHMRTEDGRAGRLARLDEQGHLQQAGRAADRADHVELVEPARAGAGVAQYQPHLAAVTAAGLQHPRQARVRAGIEVGAVALGGLAPGTHRSEVLLVAGEAGRVVGGRHQVGTIEALRDLLGMVAGVVEAEEGHATFGGDHIQALLGIQGDVSHGELSKLGGRTPALAGRARGRGHAELEIGGQVSYKVQV